MERYQVKEVDVLLKDISNSTLMDLSNILYVEDKRTYFVSLTAQNDFEFYINGNKFTSVDNVIDAKNIGDTNCTNIVDLTSITKTIDGSGIKFMKSKKDLNIRLGYLNDVFRNVTYKYVVDVKTSKVAKKAAGEVKDKSKWIEHQVNHSKKIWNEVKNAFENVDFLELDDFHRLKFFQNKYTRFNRQHPIPLRYMLDHRLYNEKAFMRYMEKVAESKPGDTEEFLNRQADYAVLMYKQTDKWTQKYAASVWKNTYEIIKKETDTFKEMQDTAEELGDIVEEHFVHQMKSELQEQIETLRQLENPSSAILLTNKDLRFIDYYKKITSKYESSDEDEISWHSAAEI